MMRIGQTYNRIFTRKSFLLLLLVFFALLAKPQSQDPSLTVIGNAKGVPVELKLSELKAVFMAERQRWPDGTKVTIAMVKSTTPLGKLVSKRIYSMSGDEVRGFWAGISFAGKFESPITFNTASELESFVAQNPGTIGILDKPADMSEVKTILIDGKKTF